MSGSTLQGKTFFCREWAFHKLIHSVDSRQGSKTCGTLIVGGPGSGKTAICSEIVWPTIQHSKKRSLGKRLLAHHFCQGHDLETLSVPKFIQGLVSSLSKSTLVPGFEEKLREPVVQSALEPAHCERNPDEAFKNGILVPLCSLNPPARNCFILVDSIDEGHPQFTGERSSTSRTVAELLANHHQFFPPWLCLVCSARKQSKQVTRMFTGFRKLSLDDLRKSYIVRDVQQYILSRLDHDEAIRKHLNKDTAEMLNQLHIKSNGCVLYLERVLDGVSDGFITLQDITEIPSTLNGLYLWECQKLFARKQFTKVRPLFSVLLATNYPLTEAELYSCARTRNLSLTREDFYDRLGLMKRLLIQGTDNKLTLFHHSFAEWLQDVKLCTQKYLCNQTEGYAMLALRYTCSASDLTPTQVQDFARNLLKAELQPTLDENHLAMWMMWAGTPLYDCPIRQKNKHKDVVQLLSKAGAKVVDIDRNSLIILDALEKQESLKSFLESGASVNQVDSNGRSLLANAAYSGNIHAVYFLMTQSPDLNVSDRTGQTALGLASRQGHSEIVKLLIKHGAKIDHMDNEGWTPLRSSAWGGHTDVVSALLDAGAKVDCSDGDKRTALRAAAWGGHADIVKKLVEHGADVNQVDKDGRTALIAAAYMGHTRIVEDLLEHGADINHQDCDGRTALSVAAMSIAVNQGHTNVVTSLIEKGADVDHKDNEGMSPLVMAAYEGHHQVVELLLEGGADVDHVDNSNRTPLIAAASMGHTGIMKTLLYWNAAVDSIDAEGRTVLCIAASQGNCEVVRLLLDRGLDEMHKDNHGWTPLHMCAHEGHTKVCRVFLEQGSHVCVDIADRDGRTPLILAAQEGHLESVVAMLDFNANLDIRSHDGRTPMRAAALEGHKEVTQLLVDRGANMNYVDADGRTTLYLLALENKVDMTKNFLQMGADTESKDLEGRTALHVSSWQGHIQVVDALMEHSADPNAKDNENRSPLQSAAWQGHVAVIQSLLKYGADIGHMCNQGATALCIAAQEGHVDVVSVLLEHGADPSHADRHGRTAMKVAVKAGHQEVIHCLEKLGLAPPVSPSKSSDQQSRGSSGSMKDFDTRGSAGILTNGALQGGSSNSDSPDSTYDKRKSYGSNPSTKSSSNLTNASISNSNLHLLPPQDSSQAPSFMDQIHAHVQSPHDRKVPRTQSPDPCSTKSSSSRMTSGSSFQTIPENITTAHSSDHIFPKQRFSGRRSVTGSLPRRSPSPGRGSNRSASPVAMHQIQGINQAPSKSHEQEFQQIPQNGQLHRNNHSFTAGVPPIPPHHAQRVCHHRSQEDNGGSLVIANRRINDSLPNPPHVTQQHANPNMFISPQSTRPNGCPGCSARHQQGPINEAMEPRQLPTGTTSEPLYHVLENRVSRSSSLSDLGNGSNPYFCENGMVAAHQIHSDHVHHGNQLTFQNVGARCPHHQNNSQGTPSKSPSHHHLPHQHLHHHHHQHMSPQHQHMSSQGMSRSKSSCQGFHVRAISQPATHLHPVPDHLTDVSHFHRKASLPVTFSQLEIHRMVPTTSSASPVKTPTHGTSVPSSPETRPRRRPNGIVTNPKCSRFNNYQSKNNTPGNPSQASIPSKGEMSPLEIKQAFKTNFEGATTVNGFKKETPL